MSEPKFEFRRLDYTPCPPDEKPARFGFTCPNGNGQCTGMLLRPGPHTAEGVPQIPNRTWEWNGDREKPTFRPSIDCKVDSKPCWHGYITDGVLKNA